jgi:hypothetical protein
MGKARLADDGSAAMRARRLGVVKSVFVSDILTVEQELLR